MFLLAEPAEVAVAQARKPLTRQELTWEKSEPRGLAKMFRKLLRCPGRLRLAKKL